MARAPPGRRGEGVGVVSVGVDRSRGDAAAGAGPRSGAAVTA